MSLTETTLISDGLSIIPKIFEAADFAFPKSGPNYCAMPDATAPNIIVNIAIKTFSEYNLRFDSELGSNGSIGCSSKYCL